MSLEIGQTVGDYEIVDILGQGGMGSVYKVRNTLSERHEAMKVLLPNLREVPELADRFLREIKVQAKLEHPNITTLRTAFRDGNQLLMVMELVDGISLDFVLKQRRLTVSEVTDYARQVLGALSYAHSMGVIHRDLKPANMMITPRGVIKLTDFGIAHDRADRKLTRTGVAMGSLYYISPEQVKGQVPDARSDIYALGITLYELATGALPFEGDTDYALMTAHLCQVPKPPIERDASIPAHLSEFILKAIAKDPQERFQTAAEFLEALIDPPKGVITSIRPAAPQPQPPPFAAPTKVTQALPEMAPPPPPAPARSKLLIPVAAASLLIAAGAVVWNRANPPVAAPPPVQTQSAQPAAEAPKSATPAPQEIKQAPAETPAVASAKPQATRQEPAKQDPPKSEPQKTQPVPQAVNTQIPDAPKPQAVIIPPTSTAASNSNVAAPPPVTAPPPKSAPVVITKDPRLEEWERLSNSRDIAALDAFRQRANDRYTPLAAKRVEDLEWEAAGASRDPQKLRAFRDKYPASPHAAQAVAEAESLDRAIAHRGIQDVLARYRAAFESRNIAALTSIWPTLSGSQLQTLTNAFKDYKSIAMTLMPASDPQFNGNQVTIACRREQKIVMKNGQTLTPQQTVTFHLRRAGSGWQIESIQ
ncbi:MAG: protein kinase [Bryobacteraceae bacterium]